MNGYCWLRILLKELDFEGRGEIRTGKQVRKEAMDP
jgi:hypothetical protein